MNDLKLALRNSMEQQLLAYSSDCEAHEFSAAFEKRMQKIIKRMEHKSISLFNKKMPFKKAVRFATVAVVLALFAVGAGAALYWDTFYIEEHDIYALLKTTNIEGAPTTLEERYEITIDLSGYTFQVISDEEFLYSIQYYNIIDPTAILTFEQYTKDAVQGFRINTEEAMQDIATIDINGCKGMYLQVRSGGHFIFWDNGDYFISVSSSKAFSKSQLIDIANSVQKVER